MCCGFLSKLRAVEKPYPAACQEGITVHELYGLWGHVMVFRSHHCIHPAQTACFSASLYVWHFYRNILTISNTTEFSMVKDLWKATRKAGRMWRLTYCFTLHFCCWNNSVFPRTDGILFGTHAVGDTNTLWVRGNMAQPQNERQTATEVLHLANKCCCYMEYPKLCKHAELSGNCNISYCEH